MTREVYHATTPEVHQRLKNILRPIYSALARTTVRGLENFPPSGPALMVTNHLSLFDPPAIFITMPRQGIVFVTTKHQRNPLIAAILRAAGCIWVERGEADRAALKAGLDVLKEGFVLGIAPEGTRSPTHALQKGKTGAAYLATRASAPILPVVVWGVEEIKNTARQLRRAQATVSYGRVFHLPDDARAKGEALEAYTTEIMCHLAALLPEKYRGYYADHPRVQKLISEQ
ncbi:MAG: 1-acyl-sn-glycerol-3-phosphate acyltransferase [Chloroflexi bacterium]|nr:1-acyl-sn-glycerol-3-phosphate acyltransferase [Chloroflexota bacterium]